MDKIKTTNESIVNGKRLKVSLSALALFLILHANAQNINGEVTEKFHFDKKGNCFFEGKKIVGLDKNTLKVINKRFFKDTNAVYAYGEKLVGIDPDSFEIINNFYFKDKNNVYHYATSGDKFIKTSRTQGKIYGSQLHFKKMEGIGVSSYKIIRYNRIMDGNVEYFDGERVSKTIEPKREIKIQPTQIHKKQSDGTTQNTLKK